MCRARRAACGGGRFVAIRRSVPGTCTCTGACTPVLVPSLIEYSTTRISVQVQSLIEYQKAKLAARPRSAQIYCWLDGDRPEIWCAICRKAKSTVQVCRECSSSEGVVAVCKPIHNYGGKETRKHCLERHVEDPDAACPSHSRASGKKRARVSTPIATPMPNGGTDPGDDSD